MNEWYKYIYEGWLFSLYIEGCNKVQLSVKNPTQTFSSTFSLSQEKDFTFKRKYFSKNSFELRVFSLNTTHTDTRYTAIA